MLCLLLLELLLVLLELLLMLLLLLLVGLKSLTTGLRLLSLKLLGVKVNKNRLKVPFLSERTARCLACCSTA